jgi:hypothetical protein
MLQRAVTQWLPFRQPGSLPKANCKCFLQVKGVLLPSTSAGECRFCGVPPVQSDMGKQSDDISFLERKELTGFAAFFRALCLPEGQLHRAEMDDFPES